MFASSKRFFWQILKVVLLVCVFAFTFGWIYEKTVSSRDDRRYQPPGTLVNVHGHWMHLNAMGNGSPTIVMDSTVGFHSLDWHKIQKTLAQEARVCTYDRPGYGWSAAVPGARTGFDAAYELHDLLKNAGEKPPYILVGHGFGAVTMQFFANLYPEEVKALVLLDPLHEEMIGLLPPARDKASDRFWDQTNIFFSKAGLHRYLSRHTISDKFPESIRKVYQAHYSRPQTLETAYRENLDTIESLRLMHEVRQGKVPTVVISSGRQAFMGKGGDSDTYDQLIAIHKKMGSHMIIEDSGHFIHHDKPDATISAIRNEWAAE